MSRAPGEVIGNAGIGLTGDISWAANAGVAEHGRRMELRTAQILNELALRPGGPTVLHDLRIPIPGFKANIDHVIVSGSTVTILDTKGWKPGFYWTFGGKTRRGTERFLPAEKKTLPTAFTALTRFFDDRGISVQLATPTLIIWPSSDRAALNLWFLRSPGARAISGARFQRNPGAVGGRRSARPNITQALATLIN